MTLFVYVRYILKNLDFTSVSLVLNCNSYTHIGIRQELCSKNINYLTNFLNFYRTSNFRTLNYEHTFLRQPV